MADNQSEKKADKSADLKKNSFKSVSIADIKELFTLMQENEIAELEIEQEETKIHIVSKGAPQIQHIQQVPSMMPFLSGMQPVMNVPQQAAPASAPAEQAPAPAPAAPAASSEPSIPANAKTINSPMVGTFYTSPSPDSPPFVREGDRVSDDTVMCIIEAMKLMNEIKAETKGKVVRILVENGMPVEFNQPLFIIEP
jgi:acetyl-CoA carboxylase biotin carboxyl carrier protein